MDADAAAQRQPKSIAMKIALIPIGAAVGLLIGWIGIRVWWPVKAGPRAITPEDYPALREMLDATTSPRGLYLFDEDIGYRFKPGFNGVRHKTDFFPHATNSLGLLGDHEIDASSSAIKILFLGDSVTYGDGLAYESIFVSRMQVLAGPHYRLANGACPGWSAQQQIGFYEKYLSHVGWDAVVFAACLNDFVDFRWGWIEGRGYQWIMADSNANTASSRVSELRSRFESQAVLAPLAKHDDATLLAWDPSCIESYCHDVLLPLTRRAKHSPIVLLALPTAHQFEALANGADENTVRAPQLQLETFCREQDIPFIDALGLLRENERNDAAKLYLRDDPLHFQSTGHQELAKVAWLPVSEILDRPTSSR
jgi:hypothetical protein